MSGQAQETNVRVQIVVEAPIEQAFAVFTEGIGTWFPPEYNMLKVPIAERVFEPRAGGRVYDRGVDGSECHWANVLSYDPPNRVVISWNINPRWQIETELSMTSGISIGTARVGSRSAPNSAPKVAGPVGCDGTPNGSPHDRDLRSCSRRQEHACRHSFRRSKSLVHQTRSFPT